MHYITYSSIKPQIINNIVLNVGVVGSQLTKAYFAMTEMHTVFFQYDTIRMKWYYVDKQYQVMSHLNISKGLRFKLYKL